MVHFPKGAVNNLFQAYVATYVIEAEFEEAESLDVFAINDFAVWTKLKEQVFAQTTRQRETLEWMLPCYFPSSARELWVSGFESAEDFLKILEQCPELIRSCRDKFTMLLQDLKKNKCQTFIPKRYLLSEEYVRQWCSVHFKEFKD